MPRMNGLDLLNELKKNHPDIGVIMMTAFGSEAIAVDSMKNGAIDYIPKPIDHRIIANNVNECIEKNRLRVRNNKLISQIKEASITQMKRYEELENLKNKLEDSYKERENLLIDLKRKNDELKRFQSVVVSRELRFGEIKQLLKEMTEAIELELPEKSVKISTLLNKIKEEFLV